MKQKVYCSIKQRTYRTFNTPLVFFVALLALLNPNKITAAYSLNLLEPLECTDKETYLIQSEANSFKHHFNLCTLEPLPCTSSELHFVTDAIVAVPHEQEEEKPTPALIRLRKQCNTYTENIPQLISLFTALPKLKPSAYAMKALQYHLKPVIYSEKIQRSFLEHNDQQVTKLLSAVVAAGCTDLVAAPQLIEHKELILAKEQELPAHTIALHPSGTRYATLEAASIPIVMRALDSHKIVDQVDALTSHIPGTITTVALQKKMIAMGTDDGTLIIRSNPTTITSLRFNEPVKQVIIDAENDVYILLVFSQKEIFLYPRKGPNRTDELIFNTFNGDDPGPITAAALHGSTPVIALGFEKGALCLYAPYQELLHTNQHPSFRSILCTAFSPSGKLCAFGGKAKKLGQDNLIVVKTASMENNDLTYVLKGASLIAHNACVAMAFNEKETRIATSYQDGTCVVIDLKTTQQLFEIQCPTVITQLHFATPEKLVGASIPSQLPTCLRQHYPHFPAKKPTVISIPLPELIKAPVELAYLAALLKEACSQEQETLSIAPEVAALFEHLTMQEKQFYKREKETGTKVPEITDLFAQLPDRIQHFYERNGIQTQAEDITLHRLVLNKPTCYFCYCSDKTFTKYYTSPCGHKVHFSCLHKFQEFLRTNPRTRAECGLCRGPLLN